MWMPDRRKYIDILQQIVKAKKKYYRDKDIPISISYNCVKDLLDLLKEQDPVKPEKEHSGSGVTWWNVCGACKTAINPNDKYCHECGKAVRWE